MRPSTKLESFARSAVAGAILAAGFAGSPAYAAAYYDGFAEAFLTITAATPDDAGAALADDLAFVSSSDGAKLEDATGAAFAVADTGEGITVVAPFTTPFYDYSVFAGVYGDAAASPSVSAAGASSAWEIVVDNIGSTGYTVAAELTFALDAGAEVEATGSEEAAASAFIVLEGDLNGDLLAPLGLTTDVAAEANLLAGPFEFDDASGSFIPFSFYVPAGDFEVLAFEAHADGVAEAFVPVPAAAWLFGSALVGLIGVARRRRVA